MKKTLSIVLVFCVMAGLAGYYPVFVTLQLKARQEIKMKLKKGVDESEIHKIVFASSEKINWVREGKEFRLNNQMFDVIRQEKTNGAITYFCINDRQEEALFANLDAMVKKQMDDEKSPQGNTASLLLKIFLQVYVAPGSFAFFDNGILREIFYHFIPGVVTICLESESPPPELS